MVDDDGLINSAKLYHMVASKLPAQAYMTWVSSEQQDRLPHTRLSGGNKGMRTVGAEAKEVCLTWGSSREVYLKP